LAFTLSIAVLAARLLFGVPGRFFFAYLSKSHVPPLERTCFNRGTVQKGHRHMAEREIVIPLAELKKVEVCCVNCGSGAVFSFNTDSNFEQRHDGTKGQVQSCPSCNTYFGSPVLVALSKWHQLVASAQQGDTKFHLKFHVSQSGDQGNREG